MPPVLEVDNVSMTFGQGELAVQALKPTTFNVEGGELAALLGPSGSGKSTLLLAISLILEPTTGRIALNGREVYNNGPTGIGLYGPALDLLHHVDDLVAHVIDLPAHKVVHRGTGAAIGDARARSVPDSPTTMRATSSSLWGIGK